MQDRGATPPRVLTLPAELGSVRQARLFVRERCDDASLTSSDCDDAVLLTSELVTNAVLHGRSTVCVEVVVGPSGVRVSVVDENSRYPVLVAEDPNALDGRGLALVEALADRWGGEERALGKAVWFELAGR